MEPTWSSSAKEMVGCSAGRSRLWFTIGGGVLNEVYYQRVDIPQIRDLGFIVAGPDGSGLKSNVMPTITCAWWCRACLLPKSATSTRVMHCSCASSPIRFVRFC
jgi:hypothetical protein